MKKIAKTVDPVPKSLQEESGSIGHEHRNFFTHPELLLIQQLYNIQETSYTLFYTAQLSKC